VPRDPDAARRAAHAILAQRQFTPPYVSPIDRLRHWLGQQLARALDAALSGHYTVLGVILLTGIAALVVWLIVRAVRATRTDPRVDAIVFGDLRLPPAHWLAEAAACERRGDYRGALRARYRALVAELARRGLVEEIPGRTAGEYRRELANALPAAASAFGGATDLFERVVYGHAGAGADESAELARFSDRVLAGAR